MTLRAAGKRIHKIRFERPDYETGGQGNQKISAWLPHAQAYADILFGTGAERRQGAAQQETQTATFIVNQTATMRGIRATDRIVYNDVNWNIHSIALRGRDQIEFTATVRRN